MGLFNWLSPPAERQTVINGLRMTISYAPLDSEPRYRLDLLSIPTMSSAIEVKSNDVSQIPLNLYLRTNNGRQRVRNNLDARLCQQPNRFQNASSFWKTIAMQATVGECFVSNRGGELNILPYGTTLRYVTTEGEVRYATMYSEQDRRTLAIPNPVTIKEDYSWNEVWHFWTFQDEYGIPIPMRTRFKHLLGLGSDIYVYMCNVYNRGGHIAGYISTDKPLDDGKKEQAVKGFKKLFRASQSTEPRGNDTLISAIDNGWKFNSINLTPQEMMLIASKEDLQRDFAQICNMPLWKLGVLKDYKYATAEAAQREYLQSSLNPLLYQIESEINAKSFLDFERQYLYVEFARDALISIDAKSMAEIDDLAVKNGGMSTDEWRERRNLPHAGQDIRQIPVNVTSANFLAANEALKLQSAALDIQIKAATLAAMNKPPAITVTIPPPALPAGTVDESVDESIDESVDESVDESIDENAPSVDVAPDPAAANPPPANPPTPATPDYAGSLSAIQAKYTADVTPEQLATPEVLRSTVRAVCAEVGALHGVADHLASFADRYADAAQKRIAAGPVDLPYEFNRMINAANHEGMKLARGVNVKVRWVGGAMDGQEKVISEKWNEKYFHPPINPGETNCYLVPQPA